MRWPAQDETDEQPAVAIGQLRQCSGIARGDALQETDVSGIAGVHRAEDRDNARTRARQSNCAADRMCRVNADLVDAR